MSNRRPLVDPPPRRSQLPTDQNGVGSVVISRAAALMEMMRNLVIIFGIVVVMTTIWTEYHVTREAQRSDTLLLVTTINRLRDGNMDMNDPCPAECQRQCFEEGVFILGPDDNIIVNRDGMGADIPGSVNEFDISPLTVTTQGTVVADGFRDLEDNNCCTASVLGVNCSCVLDTSPCDPRAAVLLSDFGMLTLNNDQQLGVNRLIPAQRTFNATCDVPLEQPTVLHIDHQVLEVQNDLMYNGRLLWREPNDYVVSSQRSFSLTMDEVTTCGGYATNPSLYSNLLNPYDPSSFNKDGVYNDDEDRVAGLPTNEQPWVPVYPSGPGGIPSPLTADNVADFAFQQTCNQTSNIGAEPTEFGVFRSRRSNTNAEVMTFFRSMTSSVDTQDIRNQQQVFSTQQGLGETCASDFIDPNPYVNNTDSTELSEISKTILRCGIPDGSIPTSPENAPRTVFNADNAIAVTPPFLVARGAFYKAEFGVTMMNFDPLAKFEDDDGPITDADNCANFYTDTISDDACFTAADCDFVPFTSQQTDVAIQLYLFCSTYSGDGNKASDRNDRVFQTVYRYNPIIINYNTYAQTQQVTGKMYFQVDNEQFDAAEINIGQCALFPAATPFMLNLKGQFSFKIGENDITSRGNTVQIPGKEIFLDPGMPFPTFVQGQGEESELPVLPGEDDPDAAPEDITDPHVPIYYSINHMCQGNGMQLSPHIEVTAILPGEPYGGAAFTALTDGQTMSILNRRDTDMWVGGKEDWSKAKRYWEAKQKKKAKTPEKKKSPMEDWRREMDDLLRDPLQQDAHEIAYKNKQQALHRKKAKKQKDRYHNKVEQHQPTRKLPVNN